MSALPGVMVAATSSSVIGIIVGAFISPKHGLGSYILLAGSRAETAQIFAALMVLCMIGLPLYGIVAWLELRVKKSWLGRPGVSGHRVPLNIARSTSMEATL